MKPAFGLIRNFFPVLYFGGLFFYFLHVGGSIEEAQAIGLGPTLLGLAILGLLFSIPLIIKIVWLLSMILTGRPSSASNPSDDGGFDADAAIARYMAQRSAEPPAAPPAGGDRPQRTSFGRKIR